MDKIFWFDVETTGLNSVKNDIIQLACMIEINGQVMGTTVFEMQPFSYENIQKSALEVNNIPIEKIKTFKDPKVIYSTLLSFLGKYVDKYDRWDKFYPAGYNVNFDMNFLRSFFKKNNDKYFGSWFFNQYLDVMPLAMWQNYRGKLDVDNFKLGTVANALKIEPDGEMHSALIDIEITREIFLRLE